MKPKHAAVILTLVLLACGGRSDPPPEAANRKEEDAQVVSLSEAAMRAARIELVAVSREAFHPHVVASGVIRPDASRSVVVRARMPGRVIRVLVDVGDRVRAGQALLTMEGSEVTAVVARYRTAVARELSVRASQERAERLLDLRAISRAEAEVRRAEAEAASAEALAARQDLARFGVDATSAPANEPLELRVVSPQGGVVLERTASPGLVVERDASLLGVADLSRVWAIADVYEKDLGQVRPEGTVEVRSDAYPGEVFTGEVALLEPALDEATRTAHLRVVLDNAPGKLRPGLFVTVAVPLRGASEVEAVAVPAEAVEKIAGLPAVFVELEPGRFELRPVETGREAHGMVEVRHGLKEGERVVARGAFALKSELLKSEIAGEDH